MKEPIKEQIFIFNTPNTPGAVELPGMDGVNGTNGTNGVILCASCGGDADAFIEHYNDSLRQVHLDAGNGSALPRFTGRKPVRKFFAQSKEEVIRRSSELKQGHWLVCPRFPIETPRDVSFITAMGIAVDLLYLVDELPEALVVDILKFYLHHPSLSVPVEPFHSILMAILEKKPLNLWSLHLLFPGVFSYVDENGIASSPDLLSKIDGYLKSLPRKEPACMSCAHFHTCFGWARYQKDTCGKWKTLLDILQRNAREIKNTRGKQPKP